MPVSKEQLKAWLTEPSPASDLRTQIREAQALAPMMAAIRNSVPSVTEIPILTYTKYREFEHTGERPGYQEPYFQRRAMLTRGLVEYILGDNAMLDPIQDILWAICEETSWVVPAHEEQGPNYWDIDPPVNRIWPLGAHTSLTREPDNIDLFAAETGAALAETIHLIGDELTPEVRQRVIQEVDRHIFKPYLAYGRQHWWFKGALNWNGVCNGSIGLAFMRLEQDLETLAEALSMVLEGFEAYIATGFEEDGGSIEGVGYWNYGLLYYVTLAELLREVTGGQLDLLAAERLKDIAYYPVGMALSPPLYLNFGDATEEIGLSPGITSKLAERTGVSELYGLIRPQLDLHSNPVGKLAIMLRNIIWWDGETHDVPEARDYFLPVCRVAKFIGETEKGHPVVLGVTAGHNDGHHSHTDIASFVYHINGESLIPDSARGKYSKQYFRQQRYDNIFNNSYTHNVPRIGEQLQAPGPEFGGTEQFYGTVLEHGERDGHKFVVIDFHHSYDIPSLTQARRTLSLDPKTGEVVIEDTFEFDGEPLPIEEAFVSWADVTESGNRVRISGQHATIEVHAEDASFTVESLEEACRENKRDGVLKRIATPINGTHFRMRIVPAEG